MHYTPVNKQAQSLDGAAVKLIKRRCLGSFLLKQALEGPCAASPLDWFVQAGGR